MQLSAHFSLAEFISSSKASELGLDNTPSASVLKTLRVTATGMEKVRKLLGTPININSGYRSLEVNKAVGSTSKKSQHLLGEAVDFTSSKYGTPREIVSAIVASDIEYDQVILEFDSWVHISFSSAPRGLALTIDKEGIRIYT